MIATPDGEFGLALIGCGGFGAYVLDSVRDVPGLRVVVCADPDRARARALAERHDAAVCTTVEEAVTLPGVDVVLLATPPVAHADAAVTALRAGERVFCEKPIAVTLEAAARVAEEADRAPGVFVVDHVLRYNPILRLLQRLGGRAAGPAAAVRLRERRLRRGPGPGPLVLGPARSGGIHIEHGVHFFDAASALMGSDPAQVQGTAGAATRRPRGHRGGHRHPSLGGAVATHTHSFTHAHRAERQLMRLDYGFAEARVTGWIPTGATLTAWTDEGGRPPFERLPERAGELLAVPGRARTGRSGSRCR